MDGKFKVFTLADLTATAVRESTHGRDNLKEQYFVEIPYGVQSIEHVALDQGAQEIIIAGLDDGTV